MEKNLAHKVRQFAAGDGHADTIQVIVDGTAAWRRKLVRLHGRPIIGWMTSAPITISGPPEAGALALTLGLGVYNAHGFGSLRPEQSEIANDMLDMEWDAIG